jgi:hypothetical protein
MEVSHTKSNRKTADQKRIANLTRANQRLRRKLAAQSVAFQIATQQIRQANSQIRVMTTELTVMNQQLAQASRTEQSSSKPFTDPNVYQHRFAASMVALCINLSQIIPLRSVRRTLKMILPAVGIQADIPDRETITRWCKRIGLDRLTSNQASKASQDQKDMIWIVDHSNQIGTQKVLVILGIPASKLPVKGETLRLNTLEVLAIEPGRSWSRDDVRRAYKELADKIGRPRWILCDGAVELRESVDVLCDENHTTNVLRDFKHVAANRFESMIGKSERFTEFLSLMGKTRCLVQQTELAHLTPPGMKTKSRFMNIEPMIVWANVVLGVLENPTAVEAGVVDVERLEQRFGWLRQFTESIASWKRCCEVIGWSLAWINTQGLESDTAQQMKRQLEVLLGTACALSRALTGELLASIQESCDQVKEGERSWLSSESIESVFGLFKRREGQQSRSGFTGLVLTLPTLLRTWTANEVRAGLQRTSTKEATTWVYNHIGSTVHSKRSLAYSHFSTTKRHLLQAT